MKTTNEKLPIADCRLPIASIIRRSGFTLIELLVVIAVMAILAGFTLVVVGQIKKTEYVSTARAELTQIESALKDYNSKYGTYPPSNLNVSPLVNTLYYELSGVTVATGNNGIQTYKTLDTACSIAQPNYKSAFNAGGSSIDGILNCTQGAGDDLKAARNFLPSLKPNRIGTSASPFSNGIAVTNLITAMQGPDTKYTPLGANYPDLNPFRYQYPGTNNPSSYDLWIQLVINGKTNLICNWTKTVIINSPLP